jgi:hypothetical protein
LIGRVHLDFAFFLLDLPLLILLDLFLFLDFLLFLINEYALVKRLHAKRVSSVAA